MQHLLKLADGYKPVVTIWCCGAAQGVTQDRIVGSRAEDFGEQYSQRVEITPFVKWFATSLFGGRIG